MKIDDGSVSDFSHHVWFAVVSIIKTGLENKVILVVTVHSLQ